jgi:hypothetical protein
MGRIALNPVGLGNRKIEEKQPLVAKRVLAQWLRDENRAVVLKPRYCLERES